MTYADAMLLINRFDCRNQNKSPPLYNSDRLKQKPIPCQLKKVVGEHRPGHLIPKLLPNSTGMSQPPAMVTNESASGSAYLSVLVPEDSNLDSNENLSIDLFEEVPMAVPGPYLPENFPTELIEDMPVAEPAGLSIPLKTEDEFELRCISDQNMQNISNILEQPVSIVIDDDLTMQFTTFPMPILTDTRAVIKQDDHLSGNIPFFTTVSSSLG